MQRREAIKTIEKAGCTHDWDGDGFVMITPDRMRFTSPNLHLIVCADADCWDNMGEFYQAAIDDFNGALPLIPCEIPNCDSCN